MKSAISQIGRAGGVTTAVLLILLVSPRGVHAQSSGVTVPPDSNVLIDLSDDPEDDNNTGILFGNRSLAKAPGTVQVKQFFGPPLGKDQTLPDGFVLLDNYLHVTTNIPQGEKRMLVRMEYDIRQVRARRIRVNSLRVLRLRDGGTHWRRAYRAIRDNRARQNARFIRDRAQFILGRYGVDEARRNVWATVDVSSNYAIGGIPVPEPAALACIGAGVGLLLIGRPRRVT